MCRPFNPSLMSIEGNPYEVGDIIFFTGHKKSFLTRLKLAKFIKGL